MNQRNYFFIFLTFLVWIGAALVSTLLAQNMTVQDGTEAPLSPENMISNFFLGDGVEVNSIQYEGAPEAVGFFSNGASTIGIDRGILMTTGVARSNNASIGADGVSEQESGESTEMGVTDLDVSTIVQGTATFDIAKYTIEFTPVADTLRFRYSFASEEYPEFVCSDYNDVFGFFISGPGINGTFQDGAENIALIPGTDLPVRINNVNSGMPGSQGPNINNCLPPEGSLSFPQFYNETPVGAQPVYDGYTDVFEAVIALIPCETYTLKLIIADVNDETRDSGVFLEAKSFGTGSLDVRAVTVGGDGILTEGCGEGTIEFSLANETQNDYTFNYTTFGTAEAGTDFTNIPNELTIPAGQSSVSINLEAFEDNLPEDLESIFFDVQLDICNRDTFEIFIRDNQLRIPELRDTILCPGESVVLDGDLNAIIPPDPTFTYSNSAPISPSNTAIYYPLEVENIFPRTVEDGVIASICIDSLLHFNIEDLDIYVVAPSGQFMELTTDNGGDGGNGNAPDFYRSTCFVADNAANDITTGSAPFIGEWQPEGEFSDLFGSPTNGTWQLLIVDDENDSPIFDGTLFEWSITFSAQYEINYQWSPAAGLSCTDCPNPTANPASTMTYTYAVSDSRGCSETAEVTVSVGGSLPAPVVSCGNISDAEIEITFTDIAGSSGYEVNVDGNGWETPNGNLSHTIMGLLPGQEVTVQVRGINNCGTAEIGSTTCETVSCVVPTVSIDNVIDVTCSSETDGEILVSASGGINGAFNFSLNGETNTTGEFFDLAAGDYQLIVFEAVDCADTLMITINEPAGIVASAMVLEEPLCVGLPGGSASVEVSGGTYPYFYQWTSGETDSIAINLRGGMNEVSIVDANDCEQVIAVDIPEPSPIVVMTSASNVNCNGAADGSIIVSATGGTAAGDYTFLWGENTSFSTNDTILDLAPDVYSLTVTDDNGCTAKAMVTIVEPDVITLSTTSTEASCSGNFDGSATVQVMGGSGDYNFAWNDPNNQTTATANGLTVGEYEVTVTDRAGGCEIVTTANVTSPNAIIVEQQAMATRCVDTSDGSLSLDISGGAGGYSVVWDDNPTTAAMRTDLSAGIYQATVSDAAGCFEIVQVRIPSPDSITYEIFSTQNSCRPQDDGTATINATGGTGNLLYQWDDLQMQQANQAFQLEAGTYSVTVTDERSCEEIASVEVTDAPPIEIMGEAGMPTCFGENTGFAEVMATGGIGELAYQWQGFTNQTANRLSDVPAGTYRVIVSDDVGCQEGFDVIVDQPTELMATTMVIPTSCENTSGDASVTPTGGTEPYTYMWSDAAGQTTSTVTGLDPTTYSVTVTDANGCSIVEMVDVSVPEQLNVNLSSTEASCGGVADGSVTAEPSGGAGGYTYQWSAGIDPTQATIADLPLGNYTVTITDTNGCSVEQTVAIEEAAPFTISSTVTDENCIQDDAGAVNITVNDGVGQLTFQWSNNATTEDIDNLPAGDYFATVTDANGCQVLINATVQPEPEIDLEFAASDVSCNGLSDGTVSVVAQNGNGNYVYQWSDNSTDPIRLGLAAGLYEVEVVDDGGCRALDSIRIQQPDSVLLDISTEPISCYDDRDGLLLVNARGGSPEYTYSLDGQRYGTSNAFINLTAGTYQVVAQDKNSCFSEPMEATIEQPEELTASLEHLLIYQFGDSLQLAPKINGGTGDLIYSWMPVDTTILSCFDCPNPYLRATFQTSVTLTVTDENNCRTNEATNIIVQKDRRIFVPTGFTPNADRTNDILLIHGEPDAKIIIFKVFDRWGELLYEQSAFDISDLKMGWDGNFRGQPAPAGVYVWYMEVEFVDGVRELYKGETTLLR